MTENAKEEKVPRRTRTNQPRCGLGYEGSGCSHPISFHGGGTSKCKALGCKCQQWIDPA